MQADPNRPDIKFRWKPGQSGNPKGRKPLLSRREVAEVAEKLLAERVTRLTTRAMELAEQGDPVALKLCLERILPAMKQRPPPRIEADASTPDGIVAAMSAITQHVLAGEISAEEGERMGKLLAQTYQAQRAAQAQRVEELIERLQQRVAEQARPVVEASVANATGDESQTG